MSEPQTSQPGFTKEQLDRLIDKAYELAALARRDGDRQDEQRWLAEVKRLGELKRGAA